MTNILSLVSRHPAAIQPSTQVRRLSLSHDSATYGRHRASLDTKTDKHESRRSWVFVFFNLTAAAAASEPIESTIKRQAGQTHMDSVPWC